MKNKKMIITLVAILGLIFTTTGIAYATTSETSNANRPQTGEYNENNDGRYYGEGHCHGNGYGRHMRNFFN